MLSGSRKPQGSSCCCVAAVRMLLTCLQMPEGAFLALLYRLGSDLAVGAWVCKTHSKDKQADQVEGKHKGIEGEAYECINSLQTLEFNLRGARKFRDKKVALQRSYHSVSRLVSWSDNSRRSQAGHLLPFDESFSTFFCSHWWADGRITLLFSL